MTPKQKLDFIKKTVSENNFSAYEIGKATGLNKSGIQRILDGDVEKPREDSLNKILDFLESKEVGRAIPGHVNYDSSYTEKFLNEPGSEIETDPYKAFFNATLELRQLQKIIFQLKKLLEDHNIDYSHITEM